MHDLLTEINSPILDDIHRIGIVLAAGHGMRIRSETSKMLHEIGASQRPCAWPAPCKRASTAPIRSS